MKAFPRSHSAEEAGGMDLRDYFAIRIYTKLMELEGAQFFKMGTEEPYDAIYEYRNDIAVDAYKMADAMMEERK